MKEFIKELTIAFHRIGLCFPEDEAKKYRFRYTEGADIQALVGEIVKEKASNMLSDFFTKKQREYLKERYGVTFSSSDNFVAGGILEDYLDLPDEVLYGPDLSDDFSLSA